MIFKAFAFLFFAVSMASAGGFDRGTFKQQLLAKHNAARQNAKSGMPSLAWSSTLASYAQEWASGCSFGHRSGQELQDKNRGENIFAAWGYDLADIGKTAATNWANEKKDYSYGSNSCAPGKKCGHYTAMVWASTTKVGCGFTNCPDGMQIVVCNYSPAGNMIGQKPY